MAKKSRIKVMRKKAAIKNDADNIFKVRNFKNKV